MSQAEEGKTIKLHYTGKLDDGTVFDSSLEREPLEVKLGTNSVIPGFEKGLLGMTVGEKKTIEVPFDQAYGERTEELIVDVAKTHFPEDSEPQVGQKLAMTLTDGNVAHVTVVEVGEEAVKLDANHPLAGKNLTFEVELLEVA